jgi:hypothetical protein
MKQGWERPRGGERQPPNTGGAPGLTHSHIVGRWWKTGSGGNLISLPSMLMQRLCEQFPDVYPTGAQLRTLQRRVQLWRNEQRQLSVVVFSYRLDRCLAVLFRNARQPSPLGRGNTERPLPPVGLGNVHSTQLLTALFSIISRCSARPPPHATVLSGTCSNRLYSMLLSVVSAESNLKQGCDIGENHPGARLWGIFLQAQKG